MQGCQAPRSSWHSKTDPDSLDEKLKLADVELVVPDVPPVILVVGGAVSTVQVREAGLGSVLPAWSVERTWNVCEPLPRPE